MQGLIAPWYSVGLVTEMSWIPSPVEAAGIFFLQGQLSVLTLISISVPPPVLPQRYAKDPAISLPRAQLNTHVPPRIILLKFYML